ncbi:hypothetical protein HDF24_19975 [Mucilaginibacter sp. X4EP1]|uniref:hypothetical protein n=1 Tax=Mucilaginibacter sp. X4EP1 TaxID=2723092 RepID=UPI0021686355|nr:hypothetical protein [Mucilaginibacter sp. X4EP1]MCS3812753.1 hypothetical protein [Mucilaginibacter sp. X4EP1]
MPQFISKLQYKTSEKGEYFDEKARSLKDTIELIKNFPWEREGYADVELTGPSITIKDEQGNYLKVGIYYGGRFSLYYLNTKRDFYKYYQIDMDKVLVLVTNFFNGQLDLQKFDKHRFALGAKSHFITDPFEYRIKEWKVALLTIFWDVYFIIFFTFSIALLIDGEELFGLVSIIIPIFPGIILFSIFFNAYKNRNQYLKISRGEDTFQFGDSKAGITNYNKSDIKKIINYIDKANKTPNLIEIIEIIFKDDSSIIFTNMLMSSGALTYKFSDKWELSPIKESIGLFSIMRLMP